jgi:FAD/FMN-containing dehydrogenase
MVHDRAHKPPVKYRAAFEPLTAPGQVKCMAADMTVIASADVTLAALQQTLAKHNQWLPMDGPADLPIGQLVELNSSGPLRLGYGAWRDLLLGAQFINGNDELITAGGQTLKNVAGYDLTKFLIGNAGVFGRLVTVTSRTFKRPSGALLAKLPPDVATLPKVITTGNRPQWAMLTAEGLLFGYVGDAATLDFYEASVLKLHPLEFTRRTVEQDVAHRTALWRTIPMQHHPAKPIFYRASVPPTRVLDFVKATKPEWWVADAAFGIVLGTCDSAEDMPAVRGFTGTMGGSVLFRMTANGAATGVAASPVEQKLLERLKAAFDPENSLNPMPHMVGKK